MKQGWEIKKLGELGTFQRGCGFLKSDFVENGFPCIHYGQIHTRLGVKTYNHLTCITEELALSKSKIAHSGDVIIAITSEDVEGSCKSTAWLGDYDVAVGAHAAIYRHTLNPAFVAYYFSGPHFCYEKAKYARGFKVVEIKPSDIEKISIKYPPLAEQERIVAELDCLSGVIEKKREQLKQLDALAQSIFYQMFGDPITNEKGWEVKKLGEVCDIYRGGSPRPIEQYLGGNIPWIKIGDAVFGTDIYLTKTKEHIIEEGLKKTRFIHSGSLIFANCGVSLGFARIITFDGCIHDGWLAFDNISNDINKIFLLKSLNFCTQYFRETAPDGTQPNLNTGIMKAFAQIIPPLTLQQEFADKIEAIEKQKELIKQSITQTEELFNSRMDYYFN